MNDMRMIATAWEARAADMQSYAAAGYTYPTVPVTAAGMQAILVPTYTRELPRYDGWLRPYDFAISEGGKEYAIRSRGRDGVLQTGEYTTGQTDDADCDIIYGNGGFVTYPEGQQK
jgi:hypothetical protein